VHHFQATFSLWAGAESSFKAKNLVFIMLFHKQFKEVLFLMWNEMKWIIFEKKLSKVCMYEMDKL
jgi:hypothetical protein